MSTPKPFKIDISDVLLKGLLAKVRAYEWHEMPRGEGPEDTWDYGANLEFMRSLCTYWVDSYDWRKAEAQLNASPGSTHLYQTLVEYYKAAGDQTKSLEALKKMAALRPDDARLHAGSR